MNLCRTSLLLLLLALQGWAQISSGLHQEDLEKYLQPDWEGEYLPASDDDSPYICNRECIRGDRPRLCYYKFTLEDYHSLGAACGLCPLVPSDCYLPQCVTADGNERGLLTANRRLPGPSIQVCLGDRVIVDILNVMPGRSTSIHFHGVLLEDTNTMDGVPMVTQCPIPEGATFRYDFEVKNDGTHFWHSHDGFQKMDGIQGSLIVRKPRSKEPNSLLYDEDLPEHVMMLTDWFETSADQKFPGLRTGLKQGQEPVSYLINGKGRVSPPVTSTKRNKAKIAYVEQSQYRNVLLDVVFKHVQGESKRRKPVTLLSDPPTPKVPLTTYVVRHGRRYRFRLIGGASSHCAAEVSIQQHRMRVIAVDGNAVKAVFSDRIVVLPGERVDFILEANQERSAYWIQVRGHGPCGLRNTSGVAVLRYKRGPYTPPSPDPEYSPVNPIDPVIFNPINSKCTPSDHNVCVHQLESLEELNPKLLDPIPDKKITFNFQFKLPTEEETFRSGVFQRFLQPPVPVLAFALINNISSMLAGSPLLTQYDDIPSHQICPEDGCSAPVCECLHLVKITLGSLVEMVFADQSTPAGVLTEPFHLHGHKFRVLQLGQFTDAQRKSVPRRHWAIENATVSALNELRHHHVHGHGGGWFTVKDTVAVPSAGFAVIRFLADNPGFWMVHSHYIYHQAVGMHVVLQVGELHQMPPAPPGFPTCGNFVSEVDTSPYDW